MEMSHFSARDVPAENPTQPRGVASAPIARAPVLAIGRVPAGFASRHQTDRIGLLVTLMGIYLFMHVMALAEVMTFNFHIHIPVVAFMCVLITLVSAFTLRLQRFFESSIAMPWMLMALPLFLASICGLYPRFSTLFIAGYLGRSHIMPILICAIVVTTRQVRHIIFWIIGAQIVVLLMCWEFGQSFDGRFCIPGYDLQNPNDLALCLIFGACFVLLMLFVRSFIAKLLALGLLGMSLLYVARTASRGALVCLTIMAITLFISSSASVRLFLLATTPLAVAFFTLIVPQGVWMRLSMITLNPRAEYSNTADEELRRAVESQIARMNLQQRAIQLAIRHPLLGVGPQMFADAADVYVRETTGRKSAWQNVHNVYLQIAAEAGIPALILYIISIVLCVKLNYRSIKACRGVIEHRATYAQSLCLLMATVTFGVGILFCNFAFSAHLPILVGLTAANALAVNKEIQAHQNEQLTARRAHG